MATSFAIVPLIPSRRVRRRNLSAKGCLPDGCLPSGCLPDDFLRIMQAIKNYLYPIT
ncbi:MAG: hypothetical protein LBK82_11785 [Planctomycetaceae bacterium]|nr:hypothetical protein [Planctomycetaceae bacterium]